MAVASSLVILFLVIAWVVSGPAQEWRRIQGEHQVLLEAVIDTASAPSFTVPEKGMRQVATGGLKRTDRCISCHLGMENPYMKGAPQPHAAHPAGFFEHHPIDEYGCTICHGGQGLAMNARDAHGIDPDTHWDQPMMTQPYIQSSCGKCHLSIFSENRSLQGTSVFLEGQEIFSREGCLGCHKARGVGGIIGPDLTEQGEKTRHEYNFQNIEVEQTVSNWLKEHFRDPEMVSPGSQMLKIDLPEKELDALTTFVLGLARPDIDFEYFSLNTLNEFKGNRDSLPPAKSFSMVCSACHGKEGEGKSYVDFETGVPAVMGADFRRVASEEYVEFTLLRGRSRRQMASWETDISGLRSGEISALTTHVLENDQSGHMAYDSKLFRKSDKEDGRSLFSIHCATCHGEEGTGGVALALDQEDLLRNAGNDYLYRTLVRGRGNATMPSWGNLETEEVYALVKYMRSWQAYAPVTPGITFGEVDAAAGKLDFLFMCSRCHGESGQGQTGPAIINADFLEVATDTYLYNVIAYGRAHTAMFGWSADVYNAERLAQGDIGNIVAFLRQEASGRPAYIFAGANPGDLGPGGELFASHCAECHGPEGEGTLAPALNNQEFLSAATNGYMMATITVGREGTAMPAWGYPGDDRDVLTGKERQDLVAWIRGWQRIRIGY